jgi:hypothetical protein
VSLVEFHDLLESVAASLTDLFAGDISKVRIAAFEQQYPWVRTEGRRRFRARTIRAPDDAALGTADVLRVLELRGDPRERPCRLPDCRISGGSGATMKAQAAPRPGRRVPPSLEVACRTAGCKDGSIELANGQSPRCGWPPGGPARDPARGAPRRCPDRDHWPPRKRLRQHVRKRDRRRPPGRRQRVEPAVQVLRGARARRARAPGRRGVRGRRLPERSGSVADIVPPLLRLADAHGQKRRLSRGRVPGRGLADQSCAGARWNPRRGALDRRVPLPPRRRAPAGRALVPDPVRRGVLRRLGATGRRARRGGPGEPVAARRRSCRRRAMGRTSAGDRADGHPRRVHDAERAVPGRNDLSGRLGGSRLRWLPV